MILASHVSVKFSFPLFHTKSNGTLFNRVPKDELKTLQNKGVDVTLFWMTWRNRLFLSFGSKKLTAISFVHYNYLRGIFKTTRIEIK